MKMKVNTRTKGTADTMVVLNGVWRDLGGYPHDQIKGPHKIKVIIEPIRPTLWEWLKGKLAKLKH